MRKDEKSFRRVMGLILLAAVCVGLMILNIICGSISISVHDILQLVMRH